MPFSENLKYVDDQTYSDNDFLSSEFTIKYWDKNPHSAPLERERFMIALNEIKKFDQENVLDPLVKAQVYESMKNIQWVQTIIG